MQTKKTDVWRHGYEKVCVINKTDPISLISLMRMTIYLLKLLAFLFNWKLLAVNSELFFKLICVQSIKLPATKAQ